MSWLTYLIHLANQYPEFFSGVTGMTVALIFSEVLRFAYFPKSWDNTDQWRAIIPIDLFTCYAFTHSLWHFLDKGDPQGLMFVGSVAFAIISLGVHLIGLRVVLKKWPWIAEDLQNGNSSK